MKTLLILIFTLALFTGCDDIDKNEITEADKLAKNPNYNIYNSECVQETNNTLCGYKEPPSAESVPTIPALLPPACEDKVYCL